MLRLNSEIGTLKGVGPALKKKLNACGVNLIEDLLFLLPYRYEDRTKLYPIADAPHNERALIAGRITDSKILFYTKLLKRYLAKN